MFSTFFRFELRFWLRSMMLYVFLLVVAILIFAASASDNVRVGSGLENTYKNAPHVIQSYYATLGILTCVMITAFVNAAASRDFTYQTSQIIFTKPLKKFGFLMGRFWGSTSVAMIPLTGVSLGVLLAGFMPWIEPERWGPISWGAHFWSVLVFVIPNTFLIASFVFTIAVLTRNSMASFIGTILLIVGYIVSGNLLSDLDNETLGSLLDPFALGTFNSETKYWTVDERNTTYLTLSGMMLWNRLLWIGVGCCFLAFAYWRFSFAEAGSRRSAKKTIDAPTATTVSVPTVAIAPATNFTYLSQLASQTKLDMWGIVKSSVFIVIMLTAFTNTLASLMLSSTEGFGLASLPVTYNMIDLIRGSMYIFLLAVITFYAGALVWKEREAKLDEVYDALPHPTWVAFLGKLLALCLVVGLVLAFGLAAGVMTQAARGYTRFQLPLYFQELFVLDYIQFFCLVALAFLCHVLSPNKYIGYFSFILMIIATTFGWQLLEVESNMVVYGVLPSYVYSDLYGFAPFTTGLTMFGIYWTLMAVLIAFVSVLLWQRGKESRLSQRFGKIRERLTGGLARFGAVAVLAWGGVAGWVYYNTQIVNEQDSSSEQTELQANYEKDLKQQYDGIPQPRTTTVKYEIDLFPAKRSLTLKGAETLENKHDVEISEMVVMTNDTYDTEVEIERATLIESKEDYSFSVYKLDPPMQPGETLGMTYTVKYEPEGFEDSVSNTSIVQNGTFFNNRIAPQIGYQPNLELQSRSDRKEYDLGKPARMPPLEPDNAEARANTYLSNSSEWVDVETVISTSADQIAIAPGSLQKSWEEDGRRYFHYKVDHPSLNFYSFISARYEVAVREWNGIDIEVYYHPEHTWNVDNMLRSIRKSLEYYTENFGPYKHKQARIIEFPRVASFAQAFPGTMPYSEGIGFIAEIEKEDDIDMVYYVVAHEMAHQWWAHQVIGANMRGATLLSETLAQYSALMVMEKEFGRDMMRKFLKYELDSYLRSRSSELLDEQPLRTVESSQGYIHYRKGSVVMYHLKEMIGESKMNLALKSIIDRFAYQNPPYPTSVDLIEAIAEQTPDEFQPLIEDLFNTITSFDNRALEAKYKQLSDDEYEVTIEVACQKYRYDGQGKREPIEMDDWVEIGAFAAPEAGRTFGETLHRQRVRISESPATFTFTVSKQPAKAGIDPFCLLIDRVPDDNVKKVSAE